MLSRVSVKWIVLNVLPLLFQMLDFLPQLVNLLILLIIATWLPVWVRLLILILCLISILLLWTLSLPIFLVLIPRINILRWSPLLLLIILDWVWLHGLVLILLSVIIDDDRLHIVIWNVNVHVGSNWNLLLRIWCIVVIVCHIFEQHVNIFWGLLYSGRPLSVGIFLLLDLLVHYSDVLGSIVGTLIPLVQIIGVTLSLTGSRWLAFGRHLHWLLWVLLITLRSIIVLQLDLLMTLWKPVLIVNFKIASRRPLWMVSLLSLQINLLIACVNLIVHDDLPYNLPYVIFISQLLKNDTKSL